jgi:fructokinase
MTAALVIGEALVDVVVHPGGAAPTAHPGGSPANVAVGLARLGVPTTLHSDYGSDEHGRSIATHLAASGVATTPSTVGDRPTSLATARIAADGAATYEFAVTWDPAPVEARGYAVVHTGSIGAALEPGASTVEEALRGADGLVSFDPNIRPALMPERAVALSRVERLVALADVVKASDEDVAWLYPDLAVADVLERWAALGPRLVVVTRGGAGADAVGPAGPLRVEAPRTTVADTIGAGDSFMAGLLADLLERGFDDPAATLRFAARCAAITVARPGADPPRRAELAG